jgi:hypothetical protein
MPHYYLEGLNCKWKLIRETPSSSKFVATNDNHKCAIDIHYTSSKSVTVNLMVEGSDAEISKGFLNPLMEDIERIALNHNDYAVIDYTFGACHKISDGNYAIDKKRREIFKTT